MWLGLGPSLGPYPWGIPIPRRGLVQLELSPGLLPLAGPDSAALGVLMGGHLFSSLRCACGHASPLHMPHGGFGFI